jgi:hypothetical protein
MTEEIGSNEHDDSRPRREDIWAIATPGAAIARWSPLKKSPGQRPAAWQAQTAVGRQEYLAIFNSTVKWSYHSAAKQAPKAAIPFRSFLRHAAKYDATSLRFSWLRLLSSLATAA